MITKKVLQEMLDTQYQLEVDTVGPDWVTKDLNFPLCIYMECNEIVDHLPWKHWKDVNAEPNKDAIAMELVDVWHFFLCFMITIGHYNNGMTRTADVILMHINEIIDEDLVYITDTEQAIDVATSLGISTYTEGNFPIANFVILCEYVDMTFDTLSILYFSKVTLNKFRQDHGYKDGKYRKLWGGKEDNDHLMEIIKEMDTDDINVKDLYKALEVRYNCYNH